MTTFDDRAQAFETKFAHEEEMEFKVIARRNKLMGLWAANRLHIAESEREKYALNLVETYISKASDGKLIEKIQNDFQLEGVAIDREELEDQLIKFYDLAREQVVNK